MYALFSRECGVFAIVEQSKETLRELQQQIEAREWSYQRSGAPLSDSREVPHGFLSFLSFFFFKLQLRIDLEES